MYGCAEYFNNIINSPPNVPENYANLSMYYVYQSNEINSEDTKDNSQSRTKVLLPNLYSMNRTQDLI